MKRRRIISLVALMLAIGGVSPLAAQEATPQAGTAELRPIELSGARVVSLSPDGTMLVAVDGTRSSMRLCVYDVQTLTERACSGDLRAHRIGLAEESVVWSPDSTRIAFAEQVFQLFNDGDIWLMDAVTGELTNLTDDGFEGSLPLFRPPTDEDRDRLIHLDVLPAWSPDGQSLAFSRSPMRGGELRGNEIVRLDLATGETERIVLVSFETPGVVTFGLVWSPDGQRLYYSMTHPDLDERRNGLWVYDEADGLASHLLGADLEKGPPVLLRVDAAGQTGLISYPLLMAQYGIDGEYFALLDLETDEVSPVHPAPRDASSPAVVRSAAFSPEGASVLYSLWNSGDGMSELWVRDLAGGQPVLVAAGIDGPVLPTTLGGGLVWAGDGTVFAATGIETAILLGPVRGPNQAPPE